MFAEAEIYIKGALGYGYRARDWEKTYSYDMGDFGSGLAAYKFDTAAHLVVATPALGISPWKESGSTFLRGLSLEISLEAGFGAVNAEYAGVDIGIDGIAIVLNPKIMAVHSYQAGKVIPYGGAGFSAPVAIIPVFGKSPHTYSREIDSVSYSYETPVVKAAFNVNLMAGAGFAAGRHLMPFVEVDFGFGFGSGFSVDARAGVAYKFRGKL